MIDEILALSAAIRYVAVYQDGALTGRQGSDAADASSAETDRYEELLVNPTLLKLASQRGEIDCGGLDYLVIRYGNFFQFVLPRPGGHVSVCIEPDADPIAIGNEVRDWLDSAAADA